MKAMELKPGINLLIGDNGSGKMSVLEGMAIAHSGLFVNVAGVSTKKKAGGEGFKKLLTFVMNMVLQSLILKLSVQQ